MQQTISQQSQDSPILVEQKKNLLYVTLNRERQLNALNSQMFNFINELLPQWCDPKNQIKYFIFQGKGRAFCAGGDIKEALSMGQKYKDNQEELLKKVDQHTQSEYQMYHNVSALKSVKQIAIMDGITMGGGCGISLGGKYRIVTENTMFAMPEAKIGFYTDAGASYFLSRLRNNLGTYLGLTGGRLNGQQMISLGLADFYVESQQIGQLVQEIEKFLETKEFTDESDSGVEAIIKKYDTYKELKELEFEQDFIRVFQNVETFEQLVENMKKDNSEFSQKTLKEFESLCPLSLRIIFDLIKRGKSYDLTQGITIEYRLAQWVHETGDFSEGTRCTLVDRNDTPNYKYKDPISIPQSLIDSFFEKEADGEKEFIQKLHFY